VTLGVAEDDVEERSSSRASKPAARAAKPAAKRVSAHRAAKGDLEPTVLAVIAAMAESDRKLAEGVHAIVRTNAPVLAPRLWYGMPAYSRDGKVVCFFQSAEKFKTRYATLGFMHEAHLDDGAMWPTAYALIALTAAEEATIALLARRAVGEIA
jgi:uncharacterized protein YdhG (YjbR/CyaY superfamily)